MAAKEATGTGPPQGGPGAECAAAGTPCSGRRTPAVPAPASGRPSHPWAFPKAPPSSLGLRCPCALVWDGLFRAIRMSGDRQPAMPAPSPWVLPATMLRTETLGPPAPRGPKGPPMPSPGCGRPNPPAAECGERAGAPCGPDRLRLCPLGHTPSCYSDTRSFPAAPGQGRAGRAVPLRPLTKYRNGRGGGPRS